MKTGSLVSLAKQWAVLNGVIRAAKHQGFNNRKATGRNKVGAKGLGNPRTTGDVVLGVGDVPISDTDPGRCHPEISTVHLLSCYSQAAPLNKPTTTCILYMTQWKTPSLVSC